MKNHAIPYDVGDLNVCAIELRLRGFIGSYNVVGVDASVDTQTRHGAVAAVTQTGKVAAAQITAPRELGQLSTHLAELQAVRTGLAMYQTGATVRLICDNQAVHWFLHQAQQGAVDERSRTLFPARSLVDDVVHHMNRLDVHVLKDSSKGKKVGQTPMTVAAHKVAYVLMRMQRERLPVDRKARGWMIRIGSDPAAGQSGLTRAYEIWRGRRRSWKSVHKEVQQRREERQALDRWEGEGGAALT